LINTSIRPNAAIARDRRARAVVGFQIGDACGRAALRRFGGHLGDEFGTIDQQHAAALGRRAQCDAAADACAAPVTTTTLPENRCIIMPPSPSRSA
jgi:hypothetical protein